jgi:hypothetical protein
MNISQEDAETALKEIEGSRLAMRRAIRSHRGHLHLWLWGFIWIAMSALFWLDARRFQAVTLWICVAGVVGSFAIGILQNRQIRSPIDRRFAAVCAVLLLFGYAVWPVFFGGMASYKAAFGYCTLLWMQLYIVAGIWFDTYLLWVGLTVTALILAGFLLVPGIFWLLTILCGAVLVGSGSYVRYFWR